MSFSLGTLRESCECEASASLRHAYSGSFFLDLEDDGTKFGGPGALVEGQDTYNLVQG
jgi:hypothetical protein